MHLVSQQQQAIRIGDQRFGFASDETIFTESSYKYSVQEFIELAARAGYVSRQVWTDADDLFSLHYFDVKA